MSAANGQDSWPASEAELVGELLCGVPYSEVAGIVGPEHFACAAAALVYRTIGALASAGAVVDPVTVSEKLDENGHLQAAGGLAALSELMRNTVARNASAHARIVRDRADRARLRQLVQTSDDSELLEVVERVMRPRDQFAGPEPVPTLNVELKAFTPTEILAPIAPERSLLPGIPVEAYTLVAGALSSYKTTFLLYLMMWKATGWDLLDLDPDGNGCEIGKCLLLTYEDTDRRIFAKLQHVIQHAHRAIHERDGETDARRFVERAAANIRRVPLAGRAGAGIVRRVDGAIVPNTEFLHHLIAQTRAFAPDGALIGLDPLRLSIAGSQNDDDGADVVVTTLNGITLELPGSGIVACSHATKADAKDPAGGGYAGASYATSGSALYSQHARSNFAMARLKATEIRDLFDPANVTAAEAERQLVVKLTHGRLSHGTERGDAYLLMRDGILTRVEPRGARSAPEVIASAAASVIPAVDRLKAAGIRLSAATLESDGPLVQALGSVGKVRAAVALLCRPPRSHRHDARPRYGRHALRPSTRHRRESSRKLKRGWAMTPSIRANQFSMPIGEGGRRELRLDYPSPLPAILDERIIGNHRESRIGATGGQKAACTADRPRLARTFRADFGATHRGAVVASRANGYSIPWCNSQVTDNAATLTDTRARGANSVHGELAARVALRPKQERFAQHFAAHGNATKAYAAAFNVSRGIRSGTLRQRAYELVHEPAVAARVRELLAQAAEGTTISARARMVRLQAIVEADAAELMRVVFECCRWCHGKDHAYQWTDAAEYSQALSVAVAANRIRQQRAGKVPEQPLPLDAGGYGFDARREPHPDCPRCRGEGTQAVRITPTDALSPAARKLLKGVRQKASGEIEVRLHDQLEALDMLNRMQGVYVDRSVTLTVTASVRSLRDMAPEQRRALLDKLGP